MSASPEPRGRNCPECNTIPGWHKETCSQGTSATRYSEQPPPLSLSAQADQTLARYGATPRPRHQSVMPELQLKLSADSLRRAEYVFDRTNDSRAEIVQSIIATALDSPPTVTEQTIETLVRALLATYPTHNWGEIKIREMVEGLLLSLGVEVAS
jgi:hypothetical protein